MRSMKPGKNCSVGHTLTGSVLLEALLSVVIMAVGLTAVMQSLTMSYKAALINKDYLQAILLAENHLALVVSGKGADEGLNSDDIPEADARFEYEQSEKPANLSTEKLLSEFNLNVAWTTSHQKNQLPVTTLLFTPPDEKH